MNTKETGCIKHTPAPWDAGHIFPCVRDWTGREIAQCSYSQSDIDGKDEAFANARLIAAAPELYEALDAYFRSYLLDEYGDPDGCGIDSHQHEMICALAAALAKVRGEA